MNKRYLNKVLEAVNRYWEYSYDLEYRFEDTEDGAIRLLVSINGKEAYVDAFGLQTLMALGMTNINIKIVEEWFKVELEFNLK